MKQIHQDFEVQYYLLSKAKIYLLIMLISKHSSIKNKLYFWSLEKNILHTVHPRPSLLLWHYAARL